MMPISVVDALCTPQVKKQVAAVMMDLGANSKVNFSISGLVVTPARLHKVGKKILNGDISLVFNSALGLNQYDFEKDIFLVKTLEFSSAKAKGGILHEGIHAVCDLDALTVPRVEAEAAAYVGQAIYLRKHDERFNTGVTVVASDSDESIIAAAAFPVADSVLAGKGIVKADWTALCDAVLSTEIYSDIGGATTSFNGIPKRKAVAK